MMPNNALIGSPIERLEDLRFTRGRGQYVDDLTRVGLLHAAILRSSVAHGRIRSINADGARVLPHVHAVFTAADVGNPVPIIPMRLHPLPELQPFEQPVMAYDKVRYVGEPIAIVLAERAPIAEDALAEITVDIEPLPAVTGCAVNDARLFDAHGTNLALTYKAVKGDAAAAFADAPYTRREKFAVQRHTALPMEPRGLMAEWDAARGRLTVWGAAKVAFFNRRILARQIGLPEASIELV